MNIYVEDKTSGEQYWKFINQFVLGGAFNVRGFPGNGTVYNEVNDNIAGRDKNTFYVLIIDKMLDEDGTKTTYMNILDCIKGCDNIFMPLYGCLERELMTYKDLSLRVGDTSSKIYNIVNSIVENTPHYGTIPNELLAMYGAAGTKFLKENSENRYKSIMAEYTGNSLARVKEGKLGACWTHACCRQNNEKEMKYASLCSEYKRDLQSKTYNVVMKSEFKMVINQIQNGMKAYANKRYVANKYDLQSKPIVLKRYNNEFQLLVNIAKYIEKSGHWNYTMIRNGGSVV